MNITYSNTNDNQVNKMVRHIETSACSRRSHRWLNENDVKQALRTAQNAPDRDVPEAANRLFVASVTLASYMDIINRNSDGWPHWSAGSRVAEGLCSIVGHVSSFHHWTLENESCECVTEKAVLRAIRRITTFCRKRSLPQPEIPAFAALPSTKPSRDDTDSRAISLFAFAS